MNSIIIRKFCANIANDIAANLAAGVIAGDRFSLAKAITLVESQKPDHRRQSKNMINFITATTNNKYNNHKATFRIGVAGPPGAGKSTLIEVLGMNFIDQGNKVSVIPIDPSSHISGGSILGDKTRMSKLSQTENAFIRASPTNGILGGISEYTSDVIFLCEAASYNIIIVESVGLGQSEIELDQVVDVFLLVLPPANGDDLQASKKGVMEIADIIIINKADGDLLPVANNSKLSYAGHIQYMRKKHLFWDIPVHLVSAKFGTGIESLMSSLDSYRIRMSNNGEIYQKRMEQAKYWMNLKLQRLILNDILTNTNMIQSIEKYERDVNHGMISPRFAAEKLFEEYTKNK